ncbi:MAG: tetratricopeptide repeat protein [Planctomycetota bacterium]
MRALFERAVELPAEQRRAWLETETGEDLELRAQVQRLLDAEAKQQGAFLEPPTMLAASAATTIGEPPQRVGPFRLLEPIGRGGMGSVWLAEQEHPQRRVAVKVMHRSFAGGRHAERFRAEIDVLARLQHPGIAQVYEAGVELDGTAWFAMELVADAKPITKALADTRDPESIVRAFLKVTDAVQHAHQRGVIHRDLKPANILRQADGTVKVIDFGIARQLDAEATAQTQAGEIVGTLAYMSPEQVEGMPTDVRTDVYGLGVVLYELLAGQRPFDLEGMPITTACRTIVERDPRPLRAAAPEAPEELQWIVQKTLQKAPAERYADVGEFVADLRSVLRHEPVRAAPPSALYVLRKFARRHRAGVSAAALVVAVTVGALVTTSISLVRTQQAEAAERERREEAEAAEKRAVAAEAAERQRRTEAEDASQRATAALDFLLSVLQSVRPDRGSKDIKLVDALTTAAKTFDDELVASPTVRAALGRAIGIAWFSLGQLEAAENRLRDSLAVHESCYGADDRRTAQVRVDLCQVLEQRGELDEAETFLSTAEKVTLSLPSDDPLHVSSRLRRGDMQRARGDKAGAEATMRPIVEWLKEHRPDDRETLLAMNLLAGVLHEQGDLDGAEPLYRASIEGFQARGETKNLDMLSAQNNLLMLLNSRGRRAEMEPVLEQLVQSCREALGPEHPQTIGTLSNLGGVRFMLGKFVPARDTFREALAAFPKDTDEHDRVLQTVLANLAKLEMETGSFAEAIVHGERSLATRRELLGDDHELTLQTAVMVADIYHRDGRDAEALTRLEDAERRAGAATPPQWPNRYRALVLIGECKLATGHLAEAEQALNTARDLFDRAEAGQAIKKTLPFLPPIYAKIYRAWGKTAEAEKYEAMGDGKER